MPSCAVLLAMKAINVTAIWLSFLAAVTALASCDPMASVEYNIHNITSDTVTITFRKDIMTSPYQGYDIQENDSVTVHYGSDSLNVASLAPNQHLKIYREWHGIYREERVIHAWRYIKSITVGDREADSTAWNEAAWHHRTKGGGNFEKEEFHYYDLWFRD